MSTLSNKIDSFKTFHKITDNIDNEFILDEKGNLSVKYGNDFYRLTNSKNSDKFLAKTTMQYKLRYGIDFLRALKIVPPKIVKTKHTVGLHALDDQIKTFKEFHNITTDIPELKIVDGRLSANWNGAWFPVSQKNKNKPLANSTLQRRYGESFLRAYKIATVQRKSKKQRQKAPINSLSELPFNQFKYDKDFRQATAAFFDDKTKQSRPLELVLTQLPNAIGSLYPFGIIISLLSK